MIIIIIKYIYIAQFRRRKCHKCTRVHSCMSNRKVFSLFLNVSIAMSGSCSSADRLFQTPMMFQCSNDDNDRVQSFHMQSQRHILGVKWYDKITNAAIGAQQNGQICLLNFWLYLPLSEY